MTKGKNKVLVVLLAILVMAVAIMPIVKATPVPVDYNRTTGSLKITKYEQPDNDKSVGGRKPLAGVKFQIFKVDDSTPDSNTEIPTKYTQAGSPAPQESSDYVKREETTTVDGTVTFEDLPIGRYLVHEEEAPVNVVAKIANFLIDIPQTTADGTKVEYDVEVAPKNETVYGSFTLNKQDHEGSPVNGATFELQQYQDTNWVKYTSVGTGEYTVAAGKIELTGLPLGTYRLIETSVGSANTGYILDNKTTYNFEVSRTPEGATKVEPDTLTAINDKPLVKKAMTKPVASASNSLNDGDEVEYTLTVDVPTSIENLKVFQVIDKISDEECLVYKTGSVKVTGDGEPNTLESTTHYTVDEDPSSGATFEVNFVPDQLGAYKGKTITITYTATFNAIYGHNDISNTADVKYSNAVKEDADGNDNTSKGADDTTTNGGSDGSGGGEGGGGGSSTPDPDGKVEVTTGGIKLVKRADRIDGDALEGAIFKLAKTEAEAKSGTYLKKKGGVEDITLTTDDSGEAKYYGLAFGQYYLVEIQAPVVDGKAYNMLTAPEPVTVDASSYETEKTVINRSGTTLPETGGISTLIFSLGGVALILISIVLLRKNKNANR